MVTVFTMSIGVLLLSGILSLLSFAALPTEAIVTLSQITGVASWIVGKDLLLFIFSNIIFWYGVKLSLAILHFFFEIKP